LIELQLLKSQWEGLIEKIVQNKDRFGWGEELGAYKAANEELEALYAKYCNNFELLKK
jgi:hypothetical protein